MRLIRKTHTQRYLAQEDGAARHEVAGFHYLDARDRERKLGWAPTLTVVGVASMPAALSPDLAAAVDLAKAEKAVSTRKAYGSDFRLFKVKAWCEAKVVSALPASPETVAAFLAAETGQGTKPSTLARRVNALLAHAPQQPLPDLSAHRHIRSMATATRQTKITFAEMRDSGVRDHPDLLLGLSLQPSSHDERGLLAR